MSGWSFAVVCVSVVSITGGVRARAPAEDEDAWREIYQQEARALELFVRTGEDRQPLEFQERPVMRWVSFNGFNGDVFIWTRGGRPEVIGNIVGFTTEQLAAGHRYTLAELHSLSTSPIEASATPDGQSWTMKSGVTLLPIKGAPRPAETQRGRLLQARAVAREFSGRMVHYGDRCSELGSYNYVDETGAAHSGQPAQGELWDERANFEAVTAIVSKLLDSGYELVLPWAFTANDGMAVHRPDGTHELKSLPQWIRAQLHGR